MSDFILNRGLMALGVLPAALLADYLGAQVAPGILGMLLLVFMIAILITQKRLREMT